MSTQRPSSVRPTAPWDIAIEPGDSADIFNRPYVFDRLDPDGVVVFRAPAGSKGADFMVADDDGHQRRPTAREVQVLEAQGHLIWRDRPLSTEARRHARALELDAAQAHSMDPRSEFRMAICRRFDAAPYSRSDIGLTSFMDEAMKDPIIAAMPGAWPASPATQRAWYAERGEKDCRQERDGISMRNRTKRIRKCKHPVEILFFHAARATNVRGSVQMNHANYLAEIADINAGRPLTRKRYDPDAGRFTEEDAAYPVPAIPYEGLKYLRFWRLCKELLSEAAYTRKTTAKAAYQKYGGGGLGDLPTHLGAMCWIDSTPVKKAFFVDDETGIPIGPATVTLMLEHSSKVVPGWDLVAGACNSSSILRTVLKANQIKTDVPEHLLKIDPNLPYLRLRPDCIGFDNATENHGRTIEQNLNDAYIMSRFVGSEMPRDKGAMERVISTFLELLIRHQVDANYDIARMRLYGFDPEEQGHFLCSIQTARRLLDIAVMTYNVTGSRALDKRQPALDWRQRLGSRKLNVLKDVDRFKNNIGIVGKATMSSAGLEKFYRRYTAGAVEMRRIVQDFERATRVPKGDIAPKPKRNTDDRKRSTWEVRIRWDEDDIGVIKVWNPYARDGGTWERFACTDPAAHGTPHWLHLRCLELAEREALDYLSPEGQSIARARLFAEIANVDAQAAERERQTLGKALADPHLRRVMATFVEVVDEPVPETIDIEPEEQAPAPHDLSTGRQKDVDIDTPRSPVSRPKAPAAMRRHGPASAAPKAGKGAAKSKRDPSAPPPRRERTPRRKNDGRRETAQTQSATLPDQRRPASTRSSLKWGDLF